MDDKQLNLFSVPASPAKPTLPPAHRVPIVATELADDALIAAISSAGFAEIVDLIREAGRRKLVAAIPTLKEICRLFAGFGIDRPVPEQVVVMEALAAIGGTEAAKVVADAISRAEVTGPTLMDAMRTAAQLGAVMPTMVLAKLLRDDNPQVRADACRCARLAPEITSALLDLLSDLHVGVQEAAGCALGRVGNTAGRQILRRQLVAAPSGDVIEALAVIATDDDIVLLGRTARSRPEFMEPVLDALEGCEHPMAAKVARGLRFGSASRTSIAF